MRNFSSRCVSFLLGIIAWQLAFPIFAWAADSLSSAEFFTSQIAHLALFIPLFYLYHFLKVTVGSKKGWRSVYLAILFFAFWTVFDMFEDIFVLFLVPKSEYFLDNQLILKDIYSAFYYGMKLAKPWVGLTALWFLFFGLKRLRKIEEEHKHV